MEKALKIRIEKLVSGGAGLGFADGPVFIPLTAPGDLVLASGIRKSRGVAFAQAAGIIEPGPGRTDPGCPWFGQCGGCSWMHLAYPSQLSWKEAIALESFSRIGKLDGIRFDDVHPSPNQTGYRYRARLHFGGRKAGFFQRGTNKVVEWDACLLLPDLLNSAVSVLRALFRKSPPPFGLKWCEGASSGLTKSLTFHWVLEGEKARRGHAAIRERMINLEESLAKRSIQVAGQVAATEEGEVLAATGGALELDVSGARLFASPGTFFQVNPGVNNLLVARALSLLRQKNASRLLDLYCGNGNFAVPAALSGMAVVGVEASSGAAADARKAAHGDCRIHAWDVGRFLKGKFESFDAVLVDPPRTGLTPAVAAALAQGGPKTLVYVSCDPATLARDLGILSRGGYQLERAELFDMFPQTPHAEIMVGMGR